MNLKIKIKEKILNDEIIKSLMSVFKGHKVFLVGGFIRDLFLGKPSYDRDLVVCDISPLKMAENIAQKTGGTIILLDKENEIYRVALDDKKNLLDIAKPFKDDILKDAQRRDFTINSIFFDINGADFFDPMGGIEAIENKIIDTYSLKNLEDDPLRLLRVFRFFSQTGFKIAPNILEFVKKNAALLNNVSKERINYEILKIFEGENLIEALLKMKETGLLFEIFPPMADVIKIPVNSHHHLDLFSHSLECVKNIRSDKPLLKLSAFLHDIGKPQTWTIEEETGRHRFIGHDKKGAEIAKKLLTDLKFSNKQISYVVKMIENHLYPSALMQSEDKSEKALARFVRKLMPDVEDIIELARADRLSAQGEAVTAQIIEKNLKGLGELLEFYRKIEPALKNLPKLLGGKEIMVLTGLKPGKELGEVIEKLKEAQILGIVKSREEAVDFIKNYQG